MHKNQFQVECKSKYETIKLPLKDSNREINHDLGVEKHLNLAPTLPPQKNTPLARRLTHWTALKLRAIHPDTMKTVKMGRTDGEKIFAKYVIKAHIQNRQRICYKSVRKN